MTFDSYSKYRSYLRSLIADFGRRGILPVFQPLQFADFPGIPPEIGGVIKSPKEGLGFRDGAILRLYERVKIQNGEVILEKYSYHYERPGGYFFRYEREQTHDPIRKPEYHLHVILDLPHFVGPSVNLEIILNVIAANFYSENAYHRQIIGQEIRLTV